MHAQVDLALYVQDRNIGKVHWAMRSLKEAMKCALQCACLQSLHVACCRCASVRVVRRADLPEAGHLSGCRWDEETFGLEYDLDLFNIVAVSFEMHSMHGMCTVAHTSNA